MSNAKFTNHNYKHSELTSKIIGAAMEVHAFLGNGFQEVIYQRALAIELAEKGINFAREFEMEIDYKGQLIGRRRVDFFVEEKIMVEIKAVIQWTMLTWLKRLTIWKCRTWKSAF